MIDIILLLVILSVVIILVAFAMYMMGFGPIAITSIGSAFAAFFCLMGVLKVGIEQKPYEYLCGFTWLVFSLIIFAYDVSI